MEYTFKYIVLELVFLTDVKKRFSFNLIGAIYCLVKELKTCLLNKWVVEAIRQAKFSIHFFLNFAVHTLSSARNYLTLHCHEEWLYKGWVHSETIEDVKG